MAQTRKKTDDALDEILAIVAAEIAGTSSAAKPVWIGRTDSYYHVSSQCSALRADVDGGSIEAEHGEQIRLDVAETRGYEECGWCRAWAGS